MSTSKTVAAYLKDRGVAFTVHQHPRTMTAVETARVAHVPQEATAKAVAMCDDDGVFLAVLPAARNVLLGQLWRETHRPAHLATEAEIAELFPDCDLGAVPPFGEAYGLETVLDGHLLEEPVVYCEGGDHETLLEIPGTEFARLMETARLGTFAQQREAEG
jgi:Ala-tRNA(Pro) deacylase